MNSVKKQIHLQYVFLLSCAVLFQFLSCLPKYDNPVSANNNGDYHLKVTSAAIPSQLEILKEYSIDFENNGTRYWKIYLSHVKGINFDTIYPINYALSKDSFKINFIFTDTSHDDLYLVYVKQNHSKDSLHLNSIIVSNPFSINGKSRVGLGDSVTFNINYRDKPVSKVVGLENLIIEWNNNHERKATFTIALDKPQPYIVTAFIGFSSHPESVYKMEYSVKFGGMSPLIDSLKHSEFHFGAPSEFDIYSHDPDSDSLTYLITADNDTLFDSTFIKPAKHITVKTMPLCDTAYTSIKLQLIDQVGLTRDTVISNPLIVKDAPIIHIEKITTTPAINDSTSLFVTADRGAVNYYYWKYSHGKKTDTTITSFIKLPPYTDTISDTVYVIGEQVFTFGSKRISLFSNLDSIVLYPKAFKYKISPIGSLPSFLKTKILDSLQFTVTNQSAPVPDDSLKFLWTISDSKLIDTNTKGSKITFKIRDSIPRLLLSLKAYTLDGKDSAQPWIRDFIVRSFRPEFHFVDSIINDTSLSCSIGYTATDTTLAGGEVISIKYRVYSSQGDTTDTIVPFHNSKMLSISFKKSGTYIIEANAIDNDSNESETDRVIVTITTKYPEFLHSLCTLNLSVGSTAKLIAPLKEPKGNELYFWDTNNDSIWDDSSMSQEKDIHFDNEGIDTIIVGCKNSSGQSALHPMVFIVNVRKNVPEIDTFYTSKEFYNPKEAKNFIIRAHDLDSNLAQLVLYVRSTASNDTLVTKDFTNQGIINDTVMYAEMKLFTYPGTYTIIVTLKDKSGNETSDSTSLIVKRRLAVDTLRINEPDDYIYINNYCNLIISAHDSDYDFIDSIFYFAEKIPGSPVLINKRKYNGTNEIRKYADSIKLTESGTYRILASVYSNNYESPRKSADRLITVKQGMPVIDSISPDSCYIYDSTTITIYADDNDQNSLKYFVSYKDTSNYQITARSFKHPFTESGWNILYTKVTDPDGQSVTRRDSVYVNKGAPFVKSITFDTAECYVKKQINFTITASDINGRVDTVFVSFDGDNIAEKKITQRVNDSLFKCFYTYPKESFGTKIIRYWAIDEDRIISDIRETTVSIKKGTPVYMGMVLADTSKYWAKYNLPFNFNCVDNGTIQKLIVNWNDGTAAETILPNKVRAAGIPDTLTANHTFAIPKDSTYKISITVFDNDTIESAFYDSVKIKSGLPVISVPKNGDTLFVRKSPVLERCTLSVICSDPNDRIVKYFWFINDSIPDTTKQSASITTVSNKELFVEGSGFVNQIYGNQKSALLIKDSVDNFAKATFYLYLDGPPDSAIISNPVHESSVQTDTVILQWSGLDKHDGLKTRFAIMIDYPDGGSTFSTLQDLKEAEYYRKDDFFEYRFKITDPGSYRVKIISKDISGNIVEGRIQSFSH